MPSFKERLRAIEAQLRRQPGAAVFTILEIGGCLPGPINFATAGDMHFDRAEGEEFEAFVERCAQAAYAAGHMALTVGGLPGADSAVIQKYTKPDGEFDFEAWWQAEAAPYYSEVPPCEPVGSYRRPSSPVMQALDRDRLH